jgi:hypothetical protein
MAAAPPKNATLAENFFFSLSPNCVGERVRVRGYVAGILIYHPSPLSSPLKGRGSMVGSLLGIQKLFEEKWHEHFGDKG